ncbi:MAG: DUF86 domain-containing protein [Candidatus Brocadiia bacterium]
MRSDDLIRLRHMLDAANEARSFAAGKTRDDLNANRMLVLSLVKDIEVLGEAATKVSAAVRTATPEIPWQDIVDMRNRLIHGYFDIDLDVVWDTVCNDLPPLIRKLDAIVSKEKDARV